MAFWESSKHSSPPSQLAQTFRPLAAPRYNERIRRNQSFPNLFLCPFGASLFPRTVAPLSTSSGQQRAEQQQQLWRRRLCRGVCGCRCGGGATLGGLGATVTEHSSTED
ncbi:hypothetical protein MHYP_G00058110 [Metynnis hypsauchen]